MDKTLSEKCFLNKFAEKKKNQILFLIFAFLSLGLMIIIFIFSAQKAEDSAALSGEVGGWFREFLNKFEWLLGESLVNWLGSHVRKIAHFLLYTLFGIFLYATFINTKIKSLLKKTVFTVLFGMIYSITDEIHQFFVEGRSCELGDVIIDTCGVITGVILTFAIYKMIVFSAKNK